MVCISFYNEEAYEKSLMELFQNLGYNSFYGPDIDRDYKNPLYMGDMDGRIKTVMERSGIDEKAAREKIKKHDHVRKNYHDQYSDTKWGETKSYDLCINVSNMGQEQTAAFLLDYIRRRIESMK